MRILFVAHSFKRGGAEKCLAVLLEYCQAKGHDCLLVGPRDGTEVEAFERFCSTVFRIRMSSAHRGARGFKALLNLVNLVANVLWVFALILRRRPDVVYTNTSAVLAGAIAARLAGVPHIWHIHENVETFQLRFVLPMTIMRRLVATLSARIVFVSALALRSLFPSGNAKAMVIHNGVAATSGDGNAAATPAAREQGGRGIGFFGSLSHRKGLDVLIRAVAIVKVRHPDVNLDVWGQGHDTYIDYLKGLSISLGTSGHLRFRGYCRDVQPCMSQYRLVVVPSRAESFSLVALEAMAAGVPLIVTRCGGPEEFVEDGVDGFVVTAGDHEGLARRMSELFDQPDHARAIARHARAKVGRDFRLATSLAKVLTELEGAAQASRS